MSVNYLYKDENEQKVHIKADLAFITLYPKLPENTPINKVSDRIAELVKNEANSIYGSQPSSGSLNNSKGRWNEFSFLYSAHTSILTKKDNLYLVKMGNRPLAKIKIKSI